jgi:shikimate kinase/3-dehydroquinate synthase
VRHLVLSGFMATGKSTLGPRLAAKLGVPFVDTDDAIAAEAGKSVPELWKDAGEGAFRALEERVITELLARPLPHVVAFGGGSVTVPTLRRHAHERASVVTLAASPGAILERVGDTSGRPNLAVPELKKRIVGLLGDRADAYAESHATVTTDHLTIDEAVDAVLEAYRRDAVLVALGRRSYLVDVVNGEPRRCADALRRLDPTRVLVVTDAIVERARGAFLEDALRDLGVPVHRVALPAGEAQKNLASVEVLWSAAVGAGADRKSVFFGFGGGVVSDLTGFAASTLYRGVSFMLAPTTLLGMVDASIGGKTGFDLPAGKNLVGTIHQPAGVLCDLTHLSTLPARELKAGLAEMAKVALVADAELFQELRNVSALLVRGDLSLLLPLVRRAIELKARFVADDEEDTGVRKLLNLGHTLGHGLEAYSGFQRYLHGEAVAIGTSLELKAADRLGLTDGHVGAEAASLLESLGLPVRATPAEVAGGWRFARQDKKRKGDALDWPIATRVGEGRLVRIPADDVGKALAEVAADAR